MTEQQRAAMQAAADTLDAMANGHWVTNNEARARSAALRAALAQPDIGTPPTDPDYEHSEAALRAQPEQGEPVATLHQDGYWTIKSSEEGRRLNDFLMQRRPFVDVYTSPPPRRPLTDELIIKLWGLRSDGPDNSEIVSFARAIERELLGDGDET